jgi:hypothetical protein
MSGYVDTIILEANRQNSQQVGEAQSNAEWTNEVSSGVKLNVGDKISVHSAFVSDLGAEDSTIEFKGAVIQEEQIFNITNTIPIPLPDDILSGYFYDGDSERRDYAGETITETTKIIKNVKDNQANIILSYYTSLNGEYIQTLPLRYTLGTDNNATAWTTIRGNTTQTLVNLLNNGLPLAQDRSKLLYADYCRLGITGNATSVPAIQPHQDGSRCMLFGRPKVNYVTIPSDIQTIEGIKYDMGVNKYRDLYGYTVKLIKIRDLLQLEVPLGFNSPSEIGSVITDQLQKNTEIKNNGIKFVNTFWGQNCVMPYGGSSNQTATNKLFNCAAYRDTNLGPANQWYGTIGASHYPGTQHNLVKMYEAGFQYIGIKRPELYISGLELRDAILPQMTTLTNPQTIAPSMTGFVDTIDFFQKTPPGSFTNQLPIFHIPSYPNVDTIRYPNVVNIPSVVDDSWHRDNLNPLFTNFLEENPFGLWTENNGNPSPQPITYNTATLTGVGFPEFSVLMETTKPIFTDYELTLYDITIECPTHPLVADSGGSVCKITSIINRPDFAGGAFFLVTFDGTTSVQIPTNTPVTITRYVNRTQILPTPYTVINTSMEWTLDNLKKIFKFFKAQERTPELMTLNTVSTDSFYYTNNTNFIQNYYNGELITPDTHRLFHLQGHQNEATPKEMGLPSLVGSTSVPTFFSPTSNAFQATAPDADFVSTSFGYDNILSSFSDKGAANGTINTSDKDFSSFPFFVKYFKDIADSQDWENMTQEEFDGKVYPNGKNVPYRCSPETLAEDVGKNLWGGFAIRNPSSCQFVPKVASSGAYTGKRVFTGYTGTVNDNMEVIKSYENNRFLKEVDFTPNTNLDPDWKETYTDSVYDCISFVCQIPYANDAADSVLPSMLRKQNIYTQVNGYGIYDPNSTPVIKQINTPYYIDWWEDVLSKDVGDYPTPERIELRTRTRRFGYDTHPTAYGNLFTGLYNGIMGNNGTSPLSEYEVAVDEKFYNNNSRTGGSFNDNTPAPADYAQANPSYVGEYITDVYIGASAPEFAFDTTTSRFSFSGLHTPEKITAKYNATLIMANQGKTDAGVLQTGPVPVPDNLGKDCYRINKVFDMRNFCPSITPYYDAIPLQLTGTAAPQMFAYNNPYVKQGNIIDSHSGIFLDQFGIDEKNWNRSFWGICGFSYNDLNTNESKGSINERIISGQLNDISLITTNQDAENSSQDEWFGPLTGVANHKPCLPFPTLAKFNTVRFTSKYPLLAPVEVESISARIEATNLPTKTLRPYFTIRSDIITDDKFHGHDKAVMPVLEVLQKQGQYGDFFYGEGTTQFTNTYPRTITSIKTQICDPSGKLATISANSAVMYKIQKQNNANLNVAEEVLNNLKKK